MVLQGIKLLGTGKIYNIIALGLEVNLEQAVSLDNQVLLVQSLTFQEQIFPGTSSQVILTGSRIV